MIALGSARVMAFAILIRLCVCALASTAYGAQPNIVMVLVDHMQLGLLSALPTVTGLARQGIRFDNARTQIALCSPSRSTILTGRYAQNTTVYTNLHGQFYLAGNPGRTIAVSLQDAGYRTGWIGKYINGYPRPEGLTYIPPGWSNWFGRIAESNGDVPYDYRLNENGVITSYGATEADYATDVYFAKALSIIDGAVTDGVPFFVVVSVHAPHDPSTPAPRHATLPAARMPTPPAFNEKDVSDKPSFIRTRKRFSSSVLSSARANYANRVRSLRAVDEGIAALRQNLVGHEILDQTYIVFMADNGMLFGEHRMMRSKGGPYEESNGVALVVRGPGIPAGARRGHIVTNADLAATFADWAGATPPPGMDGPRTLTPLMTGSPPGQNKWRQAMPLTLARNGSTPAWPGFYGVRTRNYMYAHYDTGDQELYDLRTDRYELQNIVGSVSPDFVARLDDYALQLNACHAQTCRELEALRVVP